MRVWVRVRMTAVPQLTLSFPPSPPSRTPPPLCLPSFTNSFVGCRLSTNRIDRWATVDGLGRVFPSLRDLRFQRNPVLTHPPTRRQPANASSSEVKMLGEVETLSETLSEPMGRSHLLARLLRLTALNGATVRHHSLSHSTHLLNCLVRYQSESERRRSGSTWGDIWVWAWPSPPPRTWPLSSPSTPPIQTASTLWCLASRLMWGRMCTRRWGSWCGDMWRCALVTSLLANGEDSPPTTPPSAPPSLPYSSLILKTLPRLSRKFCPLASLSVGFGPWLGDYSTPTHQTQQLQLQYQHQHQHRHQHRHQHQHQHQLRRHLHH